MNNNTINNSNIPYICVIKHAMNLVPVDTENLHRNILFWIHVIIVVYILFINSVLLAALCRVSNLFVAIRSLHIVLCLVDMLLAVLIALNYVIPSLEAVRATNRNTCVVVKQTLITLSRTLVIVEPSFFLLIVIARYVLLRCFILRPMFVLNKAVFNPLD